MFTKKGKRMKKIGRIIRSSLCALGLVLLLSPSGLQALVTWTPGFTPDVTDDDLDITGGAPIALVAQDPCNAVSINALTTDITVSIIAADATVTGNATGQTILRLNAAAGQTITFDLTGLFSLTFEGSTDLALSPLLILAEGEGDVIFNIRGGNSLTLTNNPTLNGPTLFYLILRPSSPPALLFIRDDLGNPIFEADQAFITIGEGSLLSYASLDPGLVNQSAGSILFNPTNVGNGRFVVQVLDKGAFTMAVHQAVFDEEANDICFVNRDTPAPGIATTSVVNSGFFFGADAALMINNYNATYADYLIDPYGDLNAAADGVDYSGSFDGFRYGVSAGANHVLNIGISAYLDYVGLANNSCPIPASLPCIIPPTQTLNCPCEPSSAQFLKLRNYSAFTIDGWYNPNALSSTILLGTQCGRCYC
jgi:hypothetical protein